MPGKLPNFGRGLSHKRLSNRWSLIIIATAQDICFVCDFFVNTNTLTHTHEPRHEPTHEQTHTKSTPAHAHAVQHVQNSNIHMCVFCTPSFNFACLVHKYACVPTHAHICIHTQTNTYRHNPGKQHINYTLALNDRFSIRTHRQPNKYIDSPANMSMAHLP